MAVHPTRELTDWISLTCHMLLDIPLLERRVWTFWTARSCLLSFPHLAGSRACLFSLSDMIAVRCSCVLDFILSFWFTFVCSMLVRTSPSVFICCLFFDSIMCFFCFSCLCCYLVLLCFCCLWCKGCTRSLSRVGKSLLCKGSGQHSHKVACMAVQEGLCRRAGVVESARRVRIRSQAV